MLSTHLLRVLMYPLLARLSSAKFGLKSMNWHSSLSSANSLSLARVFSMSCCNTMKLLYLVITLDAAQLTLSILANSIQIRFVLSDSMPYNVESP